MRILILSSRPKGGVSKDETAHGWFFSSLLGLGLRVPLFTFRVAQAEGTGNAIVWYAKL